MGTKIKKVLTGFSNLLVPLLATAVLVGVLALAFLGLWNKTIKTKQAVMEYLQAMTRSEQLEHLEEIEGVLADTKEQEGFFEQNFSNLADKKKIATEERKEFLLQLRSVEEHAFLIGNICGDYFNDNSIKYSPYSNANITSFFFEAQNLSISLARFARQSEIVMLGASAPSEEQLFLLREQYYEIAWYLDYLENYFETCQ